MQIYQQLCEDDFDRRIQFCEDMSQKITDDPNLVKNICFTDESTYFLNGFVNKHNCRYWDNTNPFVFREDHTQFPEKVNVWAGILGDEIIGPVFIDGNLTGQLYMQCLEDVINPLITQSVETQVDEDGNIMVNQERPHFQQDGAPPQNTKQKRRVVTGSKTVSEGNANKLKGVPEFVSLHVYRLAPDTTADDVDEFTSIP